MPSFRSVTLISSLTRHSSRKTRLKFRGACTPLCRNNLLNILLRVSFNYSVNIPCTSQNNFLFNSQTRSAYHVPRKELGNINLQLPNVSLQCCVSIGKSSRSISHDATICELTRRKISMGNCKSFFFRPSKYQPRLNKALLSLKYPGCYNSPLKKRGGNWSRDASRNCFWDGCLGRADQLLASFFFCCCY